MATINRTATDIVLWIVGILICWFFIFSYQKMIFRQQILFFLTVYKIEAYYYIVTYTLIINVALFFGTYKVFRELGERGSNKKTKRDYQTKAFKFFVLTITVISICLVVDYIIVQSLFLFKGEKLWLFFVIRNLFLVAYFAVWTCINMLNENGLLARIPAKYHLR